MNKQMLSERLEVESPENIRIAILSLEENLRTLQVEVQQFLDHPGCNQRSRVTAMRRLEWALNESEK